MKHPVILGDIGGTNTRLAVFANGHFLFEATYPSQTYNSFNEILREFLQQAGPIAHRSISLAVAGVIKNNKADSVNIPWQLDLDAINEEFKLEKTTMLNDFEAVAHGIELLNKNDLVQLGGKVAQLHGNKAVLGAGTGLGEAFMIWEPKEEKYIIVPTEGGHKDFAPADPLQIELLAFLMQKYGRVSVERILSGHGIEDIHAFLLSKTAKLHSETIAANLITERAMKYADPAALDTLRLFCKILGAESGNLALQILATGGVYVAGGIAPRLLNILANSEFRGCFEAKGRFRDMLQAIPVYIITNPRIGLIGAYSHWNKLNHAPDL